MQQSIELYFLVNFTIDALLIAIVARTMEVFALRRVLACGLLSAVYSLLVKIVSPQLAHPAIQIALILLVSMLVCGAPEPRKWFGLAFLLACGAMLIGGVGALFAIDSLSASKKAGVVCAGILLVYIFFNARAKRVTTWQVVVSLCLNGRSVHFQALIDTGNRLREPISGLPVLIAESKLLENLIDENEDIRYRTVSFGALNGSGTISCFHPDAVFIHQGKKLVPTPDVWVAIFPGTIPGAVHALAPPSFAILTGEQ